MKLNTKSLALLLSAALVVPASASMIPDISGEEGKAASSTTVSPKSTFELSAVELKEMRDLLVLAQGDLYKDLSESDLTTYLANVTDLTIKDLPTLKVLPDALCKLPALKLLRIKKLGITELPAGLGQLSTLETLYVKGCKGVKALPVSIGKLTNLTGLHLNGCSIGKLDETFGGMSSLSALSLHGNPLTELPASFGKLPLTFLDIEVTQFESFPAVLTQIGTLITLEFEKTPLKTISDDVGATFANWTKMKKFDLQKNAIEALGPKTIAAILGMPALQDFTISRNPCYQAIKSKFVPLVVKGVTVR